MDPVLFTTSTKDDRVHPGHARKMVRKLEGNVPTAGVPPSTYNTYHQGGGEGGAKILNVEVFEGFFNIILDNFWGVSDIFLG